MADGARCDAVLGVGPERQNGERVSLFILAIKTNSKICWFFLPIVLAISFLTKQTPTGNIFLIISDGNILKGLGLNVTYTDLAISKDSFLKFVNSGGS